MVCDLQEMECFWYWLGCGWHGDAAADLAGTGFLSRTLQLLHTPEGHAGWLWQAEALAQKVSMLWKPVHRSSLGASNLLVLIRICLGLSQPMVGFKGDLLCK